MMDDRAEFFAFIFFFVLPLLTSAVTIALGLWLRFRMPGQRKRLAYRSRRAMSSEAAWRFAQKTAGTYWHMGGTAALVAHLSLYLLNAYYHANLLNSSSLSGLFAYLLLGLVVNNIYCFFCYAAYGDSAHRTQAEKSFSRHYDAVNTYAVVCGYRQDAPLGAGAQRRGGDAEHTKHKIIF